MPRTTPYFQFFFFNDTATTEIYTLSLHDALPISRHVRPDGLERVEGEAAVRLLVRRQHKRGERRLTGETAFAALVLAAHEQAHGSFAFNPLEAIGPDVPRDRKSVV